MKRKLIAGAALVSLLLAGGYAWFRSQPPAYEPRPANISVATANTIATEMDAYRAELEGVVCRRAAHVSPVSPGAIEGLSLTAILDTEGLLGGCLSTTLSYPELSDEMAGGGRGWVIEHGDIPPASEPRRFLPIFPPSYAAGEATPGIQAVRAQCGGLPAALRHLAAGQGECSPVSPGASLWQRHMEEQELPLDDQHLMVVFSLARATAIMARAAPDRNTALHQLLDGIVVLRDLRQGPTSLMMAMLTIAAESILITAFQSELIAEPGPLDYGALQARMALLLDDAGDTATNTARDLLMGEAFSLYDTGEARAPLQASFTRAVAAVFYQRVEEACVGSIEECYQDLGEPGPEEPGGRFFDLLGLTYPLVAETAEYSVRSYRPQLIRILRPDMTIRMGKVLLELVQQRSEGVCGESDVDFRATPYADAPIAILPLVGNLYELVAPPWRIAPTRGRVTMLFVCPATVPDFGVDADASAPDDNDDAGANLGEPTS